MIICRFKGRLVTIDTVSIFDTFPKHLVTFDVHSCQILPPEKAEGKWISVFQGVNIVLPFYCFNIEKRMSWDKDAYFLSIPPILIKEYLNLFISPFQSERFFPVYKSARENFSFYEDWEGVVFSPKEDETEEELYEIGVALLGLSENE